MLQSMALVLLIGLILGKIFQKLNLPSILGMLVSGVILGPYALNLIDTKTLMISSELRQMALVIILIKAGLSLDLKDLKKVGFSAFCLSFIPASVEIIGYVIFAPIILKMSIIDALLLGSVMAAVSPAVVVPRMVKMIENKIGTTKSIPQMILAGASLDDIYVIVLFTSFLAMSKGESVNALVALNIPISIILGIALGVLTGFILHYLFEQMHQFNHTIKNSIKVVIITATAFLLVSIEALLKNYIAISGLLAVMSMALILKIYTKSHIINRLSSKFSKLWVVAEIILFVLVGAAVDIRFALNAGLQPLFLIIIALGFRSLGVILSLFTTKLTRFEKLFCVVAYLPKATVQAAIGSLPLALGLNSGNIILTTAVIGIMVSAPLGAIGIDALMKKIKNLNE